MVRLNYIVNARLPTEKAHGLQIVEMCEAFSNGGYEVSLVVPRRHNTPELQDKSIWEHYGVKPLFPVTQLWCFDLMNRASKRWIQLAFWLQSITFYMSACFWLLRQPVEEVVYSRDLDFLWLLSWLAPRRFMVYEVHSKISSSRWYQAKTRRVLRTTNLVVVVTNLMAEQLQALFDRQIVVERNGFRLTRFAATSSQQQARKRFNIPTDALVACYVGRMDTMGMDKGVGVVVDAFACCFRENPAWQGRLLLVGGPDTRVDELRQQWLSLGLPAEALIAVGQVSPSAIPEYLASCDVCLLPQPWTEFFAYHTSPIKMFEYMAAGKAIVATTLPSIKEILSEPDNALFVPPSDPEAMAQAFLRLTRDRKLRETMGRNNKHKAVYYSWDARALRIKALIEQAQANFVGGR